MVRMIILASISVLIFIIIIKTIFYRPIEVEKSINTKDVKIDNQRAANVLSQTICIPTVSCMDTRKVNYNEFTKLHNKFQELFPLVYSELEVEVVNGYSLLYHWKGQQQSLKPVLLTGHIDVVAVEEDSVEQWTYPPFSGAIEEGFVWGRGTLDTKVTVVSTLHAIELLLEDGYKPNRDIYLGFGHDEESNSTDGAIEIAKILKDRLLEFDFVLDEGGSVVDHLLDGIDKPLGLIGVGEKGFANIKISAKDIGGHASMPPKHTAAGYVAKAMANLEEHPMKLMLSPSTKEFFDRVGCEMKGFNKVILANLWLFKPLFIRIFSKTGSGNAMLRTTTAVTVLKGSVEANILPEEASGIVNFRIIPGETEEDLIAHIKKVNHKLPIEVQPILVENPSMVSSTETSGYDLIRKCVSNLYRDAIILPYVVLGATDARKYECVSKNIYRFAPYRLDEKDLSRMHGIDERISIENVGNCVEFYMRLLENV